MALGDLYLLTLIGSFQNQQVVNTFTYEQAVAGTPVDYPSQQLAAAFDLTFLTGGLALRTDAFSTGMSYQAVRVVNLFDPFDAHEELYSPALTGTTAGQTLAPFVAYSFRTQWLGGAVRRGFKRFCGVPAVANNNGTIAAGTATLLNTLTEALNEVLSGVNGSAFNPCVVKRIAYTTESGNTAYRLPENAGEATFVAGLQYALQTNLSTQNSRKIGRGV